VNVTREPWDNVRCAMGLPQAAAEFLQYGVTSGVPVLVVDLLEMVHVQEHQR
jgi:hypothetical protein